MSLFRTMTAAALLLCCVVVNSFNTIAQDRPEWSRPYQPFRVAGNVYYVGTEDLACFLITTPAGHILINQALDKTVDQLKANVEQLGFKFSDIKILLINQAHFDHVGGLARIQQMTGAKVMIDTADASTIADGGNSDYIYGGKGRGSLFTPVKVDRKLYDKDVIELGGTKLVMRHHPGHTRGSCSYLLTVKDEKRSYRMLIANIPYMLNEVKLPGMPTYPNVGKDFLYTYSAMKQLNFDIWVAAHSSQFGLHELRKEGDAYDPMIFSDKKRFLDMIKTTEDIYKDKAKQK